MNSHSLFIRILLGSCIILAATAAVCTIYVNADLFLSIAAGRDIVAGLIPAPDHWSFTVEGRVWVNQAWISHLIFYIFYNKFGPAGPVLLKTILLTACLGLLLFRCVRIGASLEISFLAILLGILASGPFLGIRPENFGLFFFLTFASLLVSSRYSPINNWLGMPFILVIWANFHGSFMLGLCLLIIKLFLMIFRRITGWSAGLYRQITSDEVVKLGSSVIIALIGVATLNPYGLNNLTMPFTQVGTKAITELSADWVPILTSLPFKSVSFGGAGVYFYLFFLGILAAAFIALLWHKFRTSEQLAGDQQTDLVLEFLIVAAVTVLAFRFRRLVLFAGFSMVPIAAFVFENLRTSLEKNKKFALAEIGKFLTTVGAVLLSAAMMVFFYKTTLVPYLPDNPLRFNRPLARELMSYDEFSDSLITFLKENNIQERILSGWELSGFLMLHIPEIQLFMDCRDQSYYPANVVEDFFTIIGIMPGKSDSLTLLEKYRVEAVVLTTDPIDFNAATRLMNSKKWACVYADPWSIVLVRPDSEKFGPAINSQLESLWFPNRDTKTVSQSILSHYLHGMISSNLIEELKTLVLRDPRPNYYVLICLGLDNPSNCFKPETVKYLLTEILRLSKSEVHGESKNPHKLESLVQLYNILEENAYKCGNLDIASQFRERKEALKAKHRELIAMYLGQIF